MFNPKNDLYLNHNPALSHISKPRLSRPRPQLPSLTPFTRPNFSALNFVFNLRTQHWASDPDLRPRPEAHPQVMEEYQFRKNTDFSQYDTIDALMHQCDIIIGESDSLAMGLFEIDDFKSACAELYNLGPHEYEHPVEKKVRSLMHKVMLGLSLEKMRDFFIFVPEYQPEVLHGKICIDTQGVLEQNKHFTERINIAILTMGHAEFLKAAGHGYIEIREWIGNFTKNILEIIAPVPPNANSVDFDDEESIDIYEPNRSNIMAFINTLEEVDIASIEPHLLRCPFCWNKFGTSDWNKEGAGPWADADEEFLSSIPKERRNDPVRTPCGHLYGKACLFTSMTTSPLCPVCREDLQTP
ncbi:hypothetical protein DM02DRAFT_623346 [Periconia macrospinosa]|uniref:RING-type domain-containing protein n=1 Tax=Periconia macrospinosa TaxID=97972 RepID=A0A2V1EAP4_9PLEO|nr:hypothetical protein DM02DRAFT_623346 [Periconia macrospinosa]